MQPCTSCNEPVDRFEQRRNRPHSTCKKCHNETNRLVRNRLKEECLVRYGVNCVCCGISEFEFLTIDHINNDGAVHRKTETGGHGGAAFYLWLKRNGWPPGFQVLCFNCNCSKSMFGGCPHLSGERIDRSTLAYSPRKPPFRKLRGSTRSDVLSDLASGSSPLEVSVRFGLSLPYVYKLRSKIAT